MERFWFSIDFAGLDLTWPWPEDDPHGGFPIREGDTVTAIVDEYERECERSRAAIAGADLDDQAKGEGMAFNLRYALVHMIEETARHCGHLDLLREATDGRRASRAWTPSGGRRPGRRTRCRRRRDVRRPPRA